MLNIDLGCPYRCPECKKTVRLSNENLTLSLMAISCPECRVVTPAERWLLVSGDRETSVKPLVELARVPVVTQLVKDGGPRVDTVRIPSLTDQRKGAEERRTGEDRRANAHQVGGQHYHKHGVLQPWDVIAQLGMGFFEGTIFKYIVRWQDKNGVEDLKKARHYLDKLIELQETKTKEAVGGKS